MRQSRLARDSVGYGTSREIAARAVLTAGVKAYFSRKVFALTDLRVGIGGHRTEDTQWRFGLGRRLLARLPPQPFETSEVLRAKLLCLMLTATVALPGCATARATDVAVLSDAPDQKTAGRQSLDPKVMADYIRQLPVGSRVRLSRLKGDDIRGTLMKNDGDPLVIQRRARVPEAPIAVPLQDVLAVELDVPADGNAGRRTIAIGAAVAAAGTLDGSLCPRRHLLGPSQTSSAAAAGGATAQRRG